MNRSGRTALFQSMSLVSVAAPYDVAPSRAAELSDFDAFYAGIYPELARYCWVLVRDRETAHDLAQESFTRLLSRWIRVREPRAYVYRIATNLARAAWLRAAHDRLAVNGLGREALRAQPSPDAAAAVAIRAAVERLPEKYRDIVLLHYYADLTVPVVAAAVDRAPGTVKRMLSEARALLAVEVGDPNA